MNERLIITLAAVLAAACTRTETVDPFSAGTAVAQCHVGAAEGTLSVLVETDGVWRLRCDAPWLETDVAAGKGRGAFTLHYASNESDVLDLRPARTGRIAVCLDDTARADTLIVVQQGFLSDGPDYGPLATDPALSLEFVTGTLSEASLLVLCSDGADPEAVADWAGSQGADVTVLDGVAAGGTDAFAVIPCNFAGLDADAETAAFRTAVESAYASPGRGGRVVCGQMYHYSVMQTGYAATPSWYPGDPAGAAFRSDRYAWQNGLVDVVWMKERDWFPTWTDPEGRRWAADYIYVTTPVLARVSDVRRLDIPVAGMTHHPLLLTLKY